MEFGKHSPIGTSCVVCDPSSMCSECVRSGSHGITLKDMGVCKLGRKLLKRLFATYDAIPPRFSGKQKKKLKRLDLYLDIPLVQAVLEQVATYESLKRLVVNECQIIPNKYCKPSLMVEFNHSSYYSWSPLISQTVGKGDLELVKLICNRGGYMEYINRWELVDYINTAAEHGHVHVLEHLDNIVRTLPTLPIFTDWWDRPSYNAAANGHVNCLEFFSQRGYKLSRSSLSRFAADKAQYHVIVYVHEQLKGGHCCAKDMDWYLARSGDLQSLQYLYKRGCIRPKPHSACACIQAAIHGHVEVLDFLRQVGYEWSEGTSRFCRTIGVWAATYNQVQVLKYYLEHGGFWNETIRKEAIEHKSQECIDFIDSLGV